MVAKPRSARTAHPGIHAKAGVGSLILFVMLVVIASVAAGVLIQTTDLVGTEAADPAPATQSPEAPPIQVVEQTGHVTTDEPPRVATIVLTVTQGASHETLDLAALTIEWFGPTGHTPLTYGAATEAAALSQPATEFAVGTKHDADASRPQLNAAEDRLTIAIDAAALTGDRGLAAGTTVAVKFTTAAGDTHFITLTVPESLEQQSTVTL